VEIVETVRMYRWWLFENPGPLKTPHVCTSMAGGGPSEVLHWSSCFFPFHLFPPPRVQSALRCVYQHVKTLRIHIQSLLDSSNSANELRHGDTSEFSLFIIILELKKRKMISESLRPFQPTMGTRYAAGWRPPAFPTSMSDDDGDRHVLPMKDPR